MPSERVPSSQERWRRVQHELEKPRGLCSAGLGLAASACDLPRSVAQVQVQPGAASALPQTCCLHGGGGGGFLSRLIVHKAFEGGGRGAIRYRKVHLQGQGNSSGCAGRGGEGGGADGPVRAGASPLRHPLMSRNKHRSVGQLARLRAPGSGLRAPGLRLLGPFPKPKRSPPFISGLPGRR